MRTLVCIRYCQSFPYCRVDMIFIVAKFLKYQLKLFKNRSPFQSRHRFLPAMWKHLKFPPPSLRSYLPAMRSHYFLRYSLGVSESTLTPRRLVVSRFESKKDYEQVSGIYLPLFGTQYRKLCAYYFSWQRLEYTKKSDDFHYLTYFTLWSHSVKWSFSWYSSWYGSNVNS